MTAYAYVEPPPPAVGIWFCGVCLLWREFETDVESEKMGGRAVSDCPLYCTTCQTRIDERHTIVQRAPEPPRIAATHRMSPEERAAGIERLRVARLKLVAVDDPEEAPATVDEDDHALQLRQLLNHRHAP